MESSNADLHIVDQEENMVAEWLSGPSPLSGDTNGRKGRASNVPAKVGYFGGNSLFAPKGVPLQNWCLLEVHDVPVIQQYLGTSIYLESMQSFQLKQLTHCIQIALLYVCCSVKEIIWYKSAKISWGADVCREKRFSIMVSPFSAFKTWCDTPSGRAIIDCWYKISN